MKEDALTFRAYTRIAPGLPYAKHASRVGCSTALASSHHTGVTGGPSCVRVVALLASKGKTRCVDHRSAAALEQVDTTVSTDAVEEKQGGNSDKSSANRTSVEKAVVDRNSATGVTPSRHLYARIQYDKSVVETLPLELIRERHPQLLIDYLLANAVWR